MGLWIEIYRIFVDNYFFSRQPLRWGCGLKFMVQPFFKVVQPSASAMGLWIEIDKIEAAASIGNVSLCDGAVD